MFGVKNKTTQKKIKSEVPRTKVKDHVLFMLWGMSAGRCEICNRPLYQDLHFGTKGNFAQVAHIHAVSANGPRHVPSMSKSEINDISNLMLLCYDHHSIIDKTPDEYPGDKLMKLKSGHENRIKELTDNSNKRKCIIVSYFNNLDSNTVMHSEDTFRRAAINHNLYPALSERFDLSNTTTSYEPTKEFFEKEADDLEKRFKRQLCEMIAQSEAIAVFAFASQPLLIKLGSLINDKYMSYVFQYHRSSSDWQWPANVGETVCDFEIIEPPDYYGTMCALVIDLSAKILNERITKVCGDVPIVHITIENPNRNFVNSPELQNKFIEKFGEVMEKIKNISTMQKVLLFPAMPLSLNVRLGMDYMHKTDLPITIYEEDRKQNKFIETITIGETSDDF